MADTVSFIEEWITSGQFLQGILAIILVGGWVYMIVTKLPVSQEYVSAVFAVIGFFFGSGFQASKAKQARILREPTKPRGDMPKVN